MTLEDYIRDALAHGVTELRLRVFATDGPGLPASTDGRPVTSFFIHPANQGGLAANYIVYGDQVVAVGVSQ